MVKPVASQGQGVPGEERPVTYQAIRFPFGPTVQVPTQPRGSDFSLALASCVVQLLLNQDLENSYKDIKFFPRASGIFD